MIKTDFMRLYEELDQIQEDTALADIPQKSFKFDVVLQKLAKFEGSQP